MPIAIVGFIIVFGILKGIFTATETGAIGAVSVLIIGFLNRKLKLASIMPVLRATTSATGMVFIVFIMAKVFSRFVNLSEIAPSLIGFIGNLSVPPMIIVAAFIAMYLVPGIFLDSISILIITVPFLIPIAKSLNLDIVWFAMVLIISIECGLITPPVGLNVYAVKGVAGSAISLEDIFRGFFAFFLAMVACVAIIVAFPPIVTWLPSLIARQ